jgi:pimeloyl-ACP methyl ester carboxylesterase
MLYVPDIAVARRVGIMISVNAVKYRLGTFRLHVLLARKLCELGYHVMTFDPEGVGDSEGVFDFKLLNEHYYDIQTGKYSGDLADAIAFFLDAAKLDELLLLGLCGGAISVLMEAGGDPRVQGLILLNIPVLVEDRARLGFAEDSAAKITSSHSAGVLLKQKLQRLVEVDFWQRLVHLRVDWREELRLVARSFSVLGKKAWEKTTAVLGGKPAIDPGKPVSTNRLFNIHFQNSFMRSMSARKQVLFMFAEHDPWTWIFKSEFQDRTLQPGNPFETDYAIEVVGGANHIFSGRSSQLQLEAHIVNWLRSRFPAMSQKGSLATSTRISCRTR